MASSSSTDQPSRSVALGDDRCRPALLGVGEEETGLGENVAPCFALVDFVHAAEPGLGVVQFEKSGGLADRGLVRSFDLDESGQVRPGVEVEGDLSQAPLLVERVP